MTIPGRLSSPRGWKMRQAVHLEAVASSDPPAIAGRDERRMVTKSDSDFFRFELTSGVPEHVWPSSARHGGDPAESAPAPKSESAERFLVDLRVESAVRRIFERPSKTDKTRPPQLDAILCRTDSFGVRALGRRIPFGIVACARSPRCCASDGPRSAATSAAEAGRRNQCLFQLRRRGPETLPCSCTSGVVQTPARLWLGWPSQAAPCSVVLAHRRRQVRRGFVLRGSSGCSGALLRRLCRLASTRRASSDAVGAPSSLGGSLGASPFEERLPREVAHQRLEARP